MARRKVTQQDYDLVQVLTKAGLRRNRIAETIDRSFNIVDTLSKMDSWNYDEYRKKFDELYGVKKVKQVYTNQPSQVNEIEVYALINDIQEYVSQVNDLLALITDSASKVYDEVVNEKN